MVFGKSVDGSKEEIITASIYPDLEAFEAEFKKSDSELVESKIKEMIREINTKLINYKKVKDIIIRTKEFTKTTTSKIKRYVPENME